MLVSTAVALVIPDSAPLLRTIAATPAVCSVLGAVLLVLRDEIAHQSQMERDRVRESLAHERQLQRDESANSFHVAAQSHMAKVLFDRHVSFAEAYAAAARVVVGRLFTEGPTPATRNIADITQVRLDHGLWVARDLAEQLDKFEMKFVRIGNLMAMWENKALRQRLPENYIDEVFDLFHEITGLTQEELAAKRQAGDDTNHSIQKVMTQLQALLGVEQLTAARGLAVAGPRQAPTPTS
ncbi:hypothetical protein [Stenotrophomonas sp. SAU14A_NAIMI4_8]|uniref:hypothetical protein n=1 Tax=Stenotrophomonas sp. SAU14A_NAIMI4_8 TaxID=2072409 RepID=UPI00131F4002|nr:hypothetical protein [Stenotrophomonas sp. SAU14A_NAIMI4_8]